MGGFIVLEDGRALAPNNWAYDAIIHAIVAELRENEDARPLATWLSGQTCEAKGMGQGNVDVRELTPENREHFRAAVKDAISRAENVGPAAWHDPDFFPMWLECFRKLNKMWQSIDLGQPPDSITDLTSPMPVTGQRSGPGWADTPGVDESRT